MDVAAHAVCGAPSADRPRFVIADEAVSARDVTVRATVPGQRPAVSGQPSIEGFMIMVSINAILIS
ncbi:hypothetical protein [Shinella granuli]|uniref:hypothetical protein n=1 Tax=Shinella granuli TaxID=323621 RepID=UPI00105512AF|nr:hypothetical protein [Shinella granuli]